MIGVITAAEQAASWLIGYAQASQLTVPHPRCIGYRNFLDTLQHAT